MDFDVSAKDILTTEDAARLAAATKSGLSVITSLIVENPDFAQRMRVRVKTTKNLPFLVAHSSRLRTFRKA